MRCAFVGLLKLLSSLILLFGFLHQFLGTRLKLNVSFVHLQDDENLTKEQIEEDIKRIKESNADDEGMGFQLPSSV